MFILIGLLQSHVASTLGSHISKKREGHHTIYTQHPPLCCLVFSFALLFHSLSICIFPFIVFTILFIHYIHILTFALRA